MEIHLNNVTAVSPSKCYMINFLREGAFIVGLKMRCKHIYKTPLTDFSHHLREELVIDHATWRVAVCKGASTFEEKIKMQA